MKERAHFVISGRVQGVCYRMHACAEARRLGIVGSVRNLPDGTVEIVAEGEQSVLAEFLGWCRQGPSYAKVTGIEDKYSDSTGEFDSFTVTY